MVEKIVEVEKIVTKEVGEWSGGISSMLLVKQFSVERLRSQPNAEVRSALCARLLVSYNVGWNSMFRAMHSSYMRPLTTAHPPPRPRTPIPARL